MDKLDGKVPTPTSQTFKQASDNVFRVNVINDKVTVYVGSTTTTVDPGNMLYPTPASQTP